MNNNAPGTSARRKDYITFIAISLFILMLVFEVLLVAWLPRQIRTETLWKNEVAREEMVELEDNLRAWFISLKGSNRDFVGEIELIQACLDEYATYLHIYKDKMPREYIEDIYFKLQGFEKLFSKIKASFRFSKPEKIDSAEYLDKLFKEYTGKQVPVDSSEKKE